MFPRIVLRLLLFPAFMIVVQASRSQGLQVDRNEPAGIGDRSLQFIDYAGPREFTELSAPTPREEDRLE